MIRLTICIPLLLLLSNAVQAASAPLVFGVPDYPPNSYVTKDSIGGFDVDIVKRVTSDLSIAVEFSPCSWVRCVELLKAGKIDLLGSFNPSIERNNFALYLGPSYTPGKVVFIVPKGKNKSIKTYDDLSGLTIGYETSAKLFTRFDKDVSLNKYPSTSLETLLKLLLSGRIDTIAYSDMTAYIALQQLGYSDKFDIAEYKSGNVGYLAMSKRSSYSAMAPQFDEKLHELMANGFIIDAVNSYANMSAEHQNEH